MFTKKALVAVLIAAGTLGAVATPLTSVAASNVDIQLNFGPPPPRYEVVPPPRYGYVWAPGHWQWDGYRHVWVAGYWETNRPGYVYYAPGWVEREGRWHYRGSRWDRDGDGIPDRRDRDRDGDGVPNRYDRHPDNPYRR